MKKLLMMFAFLSFAAIGSMNAQSCSGAKAAGKSCCAKKAEGSTSTTSATAVEGEGMVKKVANTTETAAGCTKTAGAKACCAKDKASCTKTTDATLPKQGKAVANAADRKDAVPLANE
jgi:hypothetical protein